MARALAALAALLGLTTAAARPQVLPVPALEVTRYIGRWYQVYQDLASSLIEPFATCVTADYGVYPNFTVSVHNQDREFNGSGPIASIYGWATAEDADQPAELTVHLQGVPVGAPYWVILLGPPTYGSQGLYEYAVVSDGLLASLFVLTRNVTDFYQRYNATLYAQLIDYGFTTPLNHPVQTPQPDDCVYAPQ